MNQRRGAVVTLALLLSACASTGPAPVPSPSAAPLPPVEAKVAPDAFALSGALSQGGLVRGVAPAGTATLLLDGRAVARAADGAFLIGFGRDHVDHARLEAVRADGTRLVAMLAIAPRHWDIQSLPTLPKGTTPTPEFLARRKIELERITAARALDTGAPGWRQAFAWPALGPISGVFGSQRIYAGEPGDPHAGVDIARPTGTPVAAPADGVVILAAEAPFSLEGNLLMIDHGMGLNSAFLHLSRIDVKPGQVVKQGQPVGAIGATGRATGPHLHWAMKWRDVRIDPQLLVPPMPGNQ